MQIFVTFVEVYHEVGFSPELKALAIQYVLIPIFKHAFSNGLTEALVGGPPNPESDTSTDCISVFINR